MRCVSRVSKEVEMRVGHLVLFKYYVQWVWNVTAVTRRTRDDQRRTAEKSVISTPSGRVNLVM